VCGDVVPVVPVRGARRVAIGRGGWVTISFDEFLELAHGRARPATVRACAHDLTVFFSIVDKDPVEVTSREVALFVNA
jgi:hypothetical protein